MNQLKTISVTGTLTVIGIKGKNIVSIATEAINLAKLLNISFDLHFKDRIIFVSKKTTVKKIINEITK